MEDVFFYKLGWHQVSLAYLVDMASFTCLLEMQRDTGNAAVFLFF
jgi:hypothetical protein